LELNASVRDTVEFLHGHGHILLGVFGNGDILLEIIKLVEQIQHRRSWVGPRDTRMATLEDIEGILGGYGPAKAVLPLLRFWNDWFRGIARSSGVSAAQFGDLRLWKLTNAIGPCIRDHPSWKNAIKTRFLQETGGGETPRSTTMSALQELKSNKRAVEEWLGGLGGVYTDVIQLVEESRAVEQKRKRTKRNNHGVVMEGFRSLST
jgi:hypothetical protein